MAKAASLPVKLDPIAALQKRFSLIDLDGQVRVIDEDQIAAVRASTRGEAANVSYYKREEAKLLMKRMLEGLPVSCRPKQVIDDFMVDPGTRMYTGVAFSPQRTQPDILNLWSPSPVRPAQGDWSVIYTFLHDVICDGADGLFDYLIRFLAHMLQKPAEKPGIMPVLLGGQGIGKGTFFELLRAIYPLTTLHVQEAKHVTTGFNASLECNFVICLDEAIFHGDRKALDSMKSLITESHISIEAKYQPRRVIQSCHRFFAASNHDHFAHVEHDDRRFLFLRVSDHHKQDTEYFADVHSALEDAATVAAMVHDLLALELSAFNVRQRPRTQEHMRQKLLSLDGYARFWYHLLDIGEIGGFSEAIGAWPGEVFVSTEWLRREAEAFARSSRWVAAHTDHELRAAMARWCASAERGRKKVGQFQLRGYHLPPLDVARREFEHVLGGSIEWPEDAG